MPDREQSTRPVASCLRESFIAFYQRDGQEAALRLLDELAYQFTCECRSGYIMAKEGDGITRSDVLAAAGDLRQAADQLRSQRKGWPRRATRSWSAMRVTLAIADASAAVQPIADQLDASLAVYLAAPSRE
jgi:hypothetical protein